MDWEVVVYVAFSAIGILQYLKGIWKQGPTWAWAVIQPVLCIGFAAAWEGLPSWISTGILALALSQIGYETIIQVIRKKTEAI